MTNIMSLPAAIPIGTWAVHTAPIVCMNEPAQVTNKNKQYWQIK